MSVQKRFGYKPDGSACLFALSAGEQLPAGWSDDVMVIKDPLLRTGEKISASAGESIIYPVAASRETQREVLREVTKLAAGPDDALRYDENNVPVSKRRAP